MHYYLIDKSFQSHCFDEIILSLMKLLQYDRHTSNWASPLFDYNVEEVN